MKRRDREYSEQEKNDLKKRRLNNQEYVETPPSEDLKMGKMIHDQKELLQQKKLTFEGKKQPNQRMVDEEEEEEGEREDMVIGSSNKLRVGLVGSGNFGSAMATILGKQTKKLENYEDEVLMWVYEELVEGRKLTEIINEDHENVKYLPGFKLPENITAEPDLGKSVIDADIILFILPHIFLARTLDTIRKAFLDSNRTKKFTACSMIKGLDFSPTGPILLSKMITTKLGEWCDDCCVMMGANIAKDVASCNFVETTLGYNHESSVGIIRPLFHTRSFQVQTVEEVAGVELCGALKNVVAMAAGFCLGLGFGASTYATIMRTGFEETRKFIKLFFPGCNDQIFFLSCGMADLICTCRGGRNSRVAKAFVELGKKSKDWGELEKELLNGQKLAGLQTCREVFEILKGRNLCQEFPLLSKIYKISFEDEEYKSIVRIGKI